MGFFDEGGIMLARINVVVEVNDGGTHSCKGSKQTVSGRIVAFTLQSPAPAETRNILNPVNKAAANTKLACGTLHAGNRPSMGNTERLQLVNQSCGSIIFRAHV